MHALPRQVILFFVGPDMCGKTNIAHEVAKCVGVPYFKASSEHDSYLSSKVTRREAFLNQLRYADPRVFDVLKQTGYSLIFDRGFPCEAVYSKVMGRETDHVMLQHMDEMWASIDARVILCHRSSYADIVDDLDSNIRENTLQRLHDAYFEWAASSKCKVHKLNVDDEDLKREVLEVVEFILGGQ
jgi:hypothetical protein